MKQLLLAVLSILFFSSLRAQTPGGVTGGNTLWLRSDVGITTSAGNVIQWQDISGAAVTGDFTLQNIPGTTTTQTGPLLQNIGINFNPYVRFNGSTSSLTSTNSFTGNLLVSNTEVTVLQVFNLRGGVVWLKWETDQQGTSGRLGFENSSGKIRFDFPKAVPASAGQNIGNTSVLNAHSLSTCYANSSSSVNRLNGADDNTFPIPGPGSFSSASSKACIGNDYILNLPAQVDMAEIIIFSRALTAAERSKIESYLAVKYGFTLNQLPANANNYVASDGTIIWNTVNNTAYANDITGVGRDDVSGLSQKQSKSINATSVVTLYNGNFPTGSFPTQNSTNANSFAADKSFLLIGDNGLSITPDQCIYNGKGQRMQRIWRVSKQNMSGPITYSLRQGTIAATIKNMIVSTDPAFPPASTTMYPLTAAGGNLFANLSLNHDDYFSFTTDTIIVNLAPTSPTCADPNSGSVTSTITGNGNTLTYSWNPSGQTTPGLTNVPAGTYTLTVTQGTCNATYQATIAPTPAPTAPVVNNASVCSGGTATLTVQSPNAAYTYNWYTVATGGTPVSTGTSYTTPALTATTTYYVDATGTCVGPRTAVTVSVITVNTPTANNVTICSGNTATLTVQTPVAGETYSWYAVSSGGTPLATGTSYTTPVLTTTTTYYVEAANGTCISGRSPVTVTVNSAAAPVVNNTTICSGSTATLTVQSPNASYTYNWYAASTGGSPLTTGTSYTTPVLTSTTTYYVEAVNSGCPSTRTAVTVTVTTISAPTANGTSVCTGGTATLTVQSPNAAYTYNWYTVSTGGVPVGTGTSYTTPPITTATTYYVEATDGTCTGPRTAVTVNIVTVNTPTANNVTICSGNTATLTVQTPVAGETYSWYAASSGGTALATGTSYTTPVLTTTTTYYVEAANGSCISSRSSVTVTVNSTAAPAVNNATICTGSTATLSVQGPNASYTYNWYAASTGGSILSSGTTFTTPALTSTTTYYVEAVNNGCPSTRTAVTVTVITIPAPAVNSASTCSGTSTVLDIQGPNASYSYNWYNVSSGGTSVFTGISYTTPPVTTNSVFYAEATDGTCISPRTPAQVIILPELDTPMVHVTSATVSTVSFAWPPVAGAVDYLISVDGGAYFNSPGGTSSLAYTVTGLNPSQSVTLAVVAVSGPTGCGDSDPGHATGITGGNGFYVPTAFTPNGDHKNDLLSPRLPGGSTLDYFLVWNRWGQKIFSMNIATGTGWDGTWQSKEQPMGIYVWMCRYRDITGKLIDQQGTTLLIR